MGSINALEMALFLLTVAPLARMVYTQSVSFTITNFSSSSNLLLLGNTVVGNDGSLDMTYNSSGATGPYFISRVLHSSPILMHNLTQGLAASFSTSFTFSIATNETNISGDGFTFIIAPSNVMPHTRSATAAAMGTYDVDLYTASNASLLHFVAVEYDTFLNLEYHDPDDHHVALDIHSLTSIEAQSLPSELVLKTTNFSRRLTTWIDYDALEHQLDVYLAVAPAQKTSAKKVLSYSKLSLWDYVLSSSYVGFTASTGIFQERHSIYDWNFSSRMVPIPIPIPIPPSPSPSPSSTRKKMLVVGLTISLGSVLLLVAVLFAAKKRLMSTGLHLDVDLMTAPRRFTYRELRMATGDFKEILGHGGSAKVYRGMITTSNAGVEHVAVKRISRASKHGEKEFKSEVLTIGRLRHRNLVHLYGWCSEKGELLLVYQFMPNGSLDKLLHPSGGTSGDVLGWPLRFNILRGVAAALVYLHVDCEKRIIHRDIKASNVLLDSNLNARLGDFGLARYFDHDQYCTESSATGVAGTWGYMAPEYAMSGRVTMESDIFSFGVLALEIACGRHPLPNPNAEESLVDYVWRKHEEGQLMHVADGRLQGQFDVDEMRCMIHIGLLCTHPDPRSRLPTIQVLQILRRDVELPELPVCRPTAVYVQVPTTKVYRSGILTSRPFSGPSDTASFLENIELSEPR